MEVWAFPIQTVLHSLAGLFGLRAAGDSGRGTDPTRAIGNGITP